MGLKSSVSIRGSRFFLCLLFLLVMSLLFGGREELSSLHHPKDFHTFGKNRFQRSSFYPHKTTESGTLRGLEIPICTAQGNQELPSIYGNKIVWMDFRNDSGDIYMYDLSLKKEIPICIATNAQWDPVIYGDKIVWYDWRSGERDIYIYDLLSKEEIPICTDPHAQLHPAMYGDKIVWKDNRNGNWDIYMYDLTLKKEIPICVEPHDQAGPAIYGDKIVWEDFRNGNWDIYMYDLTLKKEIPICVEPHNQGGPVIYGDKVVWVDWRNGNYDLFMNSDIYMYDLSLDKEIPICIEPNNQWTRPGIYGDKIVWADDRNGNWDIYMYDLTTKKERPICVEPHDQWHAKIYGDKIVWMDKRNSNWDIYMYDLSTLQVSFSKSADKTSVSTGGILTYNLYFKNEGDTTINNITITDYIPTGTSYVQGSTTGGGTYDEKNRKLSWQISSLPPGKEGNLSFKVIVEGGEDVNRIDNKATLTLENLYLESNTVSVEVLREWTVMIYLAAKNNLVSICPEILVGAQKVGSTKDVYIVAQTMASSGSARFFIKKNELQKEQDLTVTTTGDPAQLSDFIKWSSQNYPAKHYALIIWDHGGGWRGKEDLTRGIAYDDIASDFLATPELREALEKAGIKLELLIFNACMMQMLEVATEIKDWTDVICASEEIMWGGSDSRVYECFLSRLVNEPLMDAVKLGKAFACAYFATYSNGKDITISVISTTTIAQLVQTLDRLGEQLICAFPFEKANIKKAIEETQKFYWPDYKDLFRFCVNLYSYVKDSDVKKAVLEVVSLRGKVVLHEQHTDGLPHAYGLSIYLPMESLDKKGFDPCYSALRFVKLAPHWLDFLELLNNIGYIYLSVDKKFAGKGDILTYSLAIFNPTQHILNNIIVKDTIPFNTSYVNGSATGNPTYDADTTTLIWKIDSLPPEQMLIFSFQVKINRGLWVKNKAQLICGEISIDSEEVNTWLIRVAKNVNRAVVGVGGELTYSLYYENNSDETLTNVTIIDQLPPATKFKDISSDKRPSSFETNTITWDIGTLLPDQRGSFSYLVEVTNDAQDGAELETFATLSGEGNVSLDSNTVSTIVDRIPPNITIHIPERGLSQLPILIGYITDGNLVNVVFTLDNQKLPTYLDLASGLCFTIPSAPLTPGRHILSITATDGGDNTSQCSFTFEVSSQPLPLHQIELLCFPFTIEGSLSNALTNLERAYIWTGSMYNPEQTPPLYQGFWAKLSSPFHPSNLNLLGMAKNVCSGENEVVIPLKKGWQIIGLPWSYPIILCDVIQLEKNGQRIPFPEADKLIGLILFRWDGEKYCAVGPLNGLENTLYPWFGYWIMVKEDCKLVLPKEPWKVRAQRFSSKEGFCIPIKAISSDGKSEEVYIGIGKKEISSAFPPPAPYSSATRQISILKEEQSLFMDIRKEGGNQKWQIAVRGGTTLLFPNLSNLPKSHQIILTNGDKRYYLKTTSSVKVDSDKILEVEIGNGLITPLIINMIDTRTNRGGITISWSVNLDCQVKLGIRSLEGRLVKDLGVRSSSAGLNSLFWDGKGADGRPLPSGIYIVELTARDEINQMVKAIKVVILR